MDVEDLKRWYPKLFAAAKAEGGRQERDRITGHVSMGEKVGDVALAIKAIRDGSDLASVLRHYLAAARNRADIAARLEDDAQAVAVIAGMELPKSGYVDRVGEAIVSRLERLVGKTAAGEVRIEDQEAP